MNHMDHSEPPDRPVDWFTVIIGGVLIAASIITALVVIQP